MDERSRWWPGFCAPTTVEYRGSVPRFGTMSSGDSCATSNSGFWTLPEDLEHRGHRTRDRAACLKLCLGCARCNYVSVSSVQRECGWFWKCPPLDELTILAGGLPDLRVRYDHYPAKQGYGRAGTAEVTANAAQKQCPPTCRRLEATLTWARGPPP